MAARRPAGRAGHAPRHNHQTAGFQRRLRHPTAMSGLGLAIALTAVCSVPVGMAIGWFLRRANTWCPRCGGVLTCRGCGQRPNRDRFRANQRWEL